jgi:hypothetical protein
LERRLYFLGAAGDCHAAAEPRVNDGSLIGGLIGTVGVIAGALFGYLGIRRQTAAVQAEAKATAQASVDQAMIQAQPSMQAAVTANLVLLLQERNREREQLKAEIAQVKVECDARADKAEQVSRQADKRSADAERRLEEVERFLSDCRRKLEQFYRKPDDPARRAYDREQDDHAE